MSWPTSVLRPSQSAPMQCDIVSNGKGDLRSIVGYQVHAILNKEVAQLVWACGTTVHDNLEVSQQGDSERRLREELERIRDSVKDLEAMSRHDLGEVLGRQGQVGVVHVNGLASVHSPVEVAYPVVVIQWKCDECLHL